MGTNDTPLDLDEVARRLGVSLRTVYNYIARGDLRVVTVTGHGLHKRSAVRPSEVRRFKAWRKARA